MKKNLTMTPLTRRAATPSGDAIPLGARIGGVCRLDEQAVPWVDFPGNTQGPVAARLALPTKEAMRLSADWQRVQVLLVFANQDIRQPVITGIVTESLPQACAPALLIPPRVELQAGEELLMQCGDAKIVLQRDGKVMIGGREIDSRAQQKHRIRGGTVSIN